jgi:predicted nuclease with TOPRIM domain
LVSKQAAELEASDRRAADIETRVTVEIMAIKAERQELKTMLKTLIDKIGMVNDNSQALKPQVERQNEDLFGDISTEPVKPLLQLNDGKQQSNSYFCFLWGKL